MAADFGSADSWVNFVSPLIHTLPPNIRDCVLSMQELFKFGPRIRHQSAFVPDVPNMLKRAQLAEIKTRCADLGNQLALYMASCANQLDHTLSDMSPEIVRRAPKRPIGPALQQAGLNRLIWATGVGAAGDRDDDQVWDHYARLANDWIACWALGIFMGTGFSDDPGWVRTGFAGEDFRKLYSNETRLVEFSESICQGIAEWVSRSTLKTSNLTCITKDAIAYTFNWLRRIVLDVPSDLYAAPTKIQSLAQLLSLEAGKRHGIGFEKLMTTSDADRYPFVQLARGPVLLAWREAACGLEISLLSAIGRASGGDQGAAFEYACASVLGHYAPHDLQVRSSGLTMEPRLYSDPLETDIVLQGDKGTWIIECKGLVPHATKAGVTASFSDDLGKGLRQATKRLVHLSKGAQVMKDGLTISQPYPSARGGIVVTLHSFGGAVWSSEALEGAHGKNKSVSVPIHSILLVLSCMYNARELRRYMAYRIALMQNSLKATDELEILLAWFSEDPWEALRTVGTTTVIAPLGLTWDVILGSVPEDRDSWRQILWDEAS